MYFVILAALPIAASTRKAGRGRVYGVRLLRRARRFFFAAADCPPCSIP